MVFKNKKYWLSVIGLIFASALFLFLAKNVAQTEVTTVSGQSLAVQLAECLPKSDMGAKARCDALLAEVDTFAECMAAGFTIETTNPGQCRTPDGRSFTEETNNDWLTVVRLLKDCQVKAVMQTHSRSVTVTLKNGQEISAQEPQIDDVFTVISQLSGRCGNIIMATE